MATYMMPCGQKIDGRPDQHIVRCRVCAAWWVKRNQQKEKS